jgi:NAD(P)H dehydrogenase (quinone)
MVFKDDLFLITGATGNTGAPTVQILRILRAAGRRVRAFVHERDARSRYLEALRLEEPRRCAGLMG